MNRLHDIDLNLLVVLHELLRTPSVQAVAGRLGRTPSAVSHALRRLRERLDDPLFVRVGSVLQPTARARSLAARLESALGELASVVASGPEFDPRVASREFLVSCADYHEITLLPALVPCLAERAPGLSLRGINLANRVEQAVADGDVDLGIAVSPCPLPGLRQRALFREEFVVVMRRVHPFAGKRLTLKRFIEADHALIAPRGTPGSRVDDVLAEMGLSRRIRVYTAHFVTAPIVATTSDLLVTLPRRVAEALAPHHDLVISRPPIEIPDFSVVMLWADPMDRDPAHAWLRDRIAEIAR